MNVKTNSMVAYTADVASTDSTDFSLQCNVRVQGESKNFEAGRVVRNSDKVQVATFNYYSSLNLSYQTNVETEQQAILTLVNDFIAASKVADLSVISNA